MFTGIIEQFGILKKITKERNNLMLNVEAPFLKELTINQSIAHNGICLTVSKLNKDDYTVCAVNETINRTNIGFLQEGDFINLERCLAVGDRLDGHFVQGHIDDIIQCNEIRDEKGSWIFQFKYKKNSSNYIVSKGSIALNGVSLTIANVNYDKNCFEIAIIPYTFQHTNFKLLKTGDYVNVEFDIITKQIAQLNKRR